MTFAIPDSPFGVRVARRLRDDAIGWLTVVDAAGVPQPAPIWFLWDGETALIYSDRRAKRLAHIAEQPAAALTLDSDGKGGDVVVLTGEVHVDESVQPPAENLPYLTKYGVMIANGPWRTPETFAETFGTPIRFTPKRLRGH